MLAQRQTLEIYIDRAGNDGIYPVLARVLETNQQARGALQLPAIADELVNARRWLAMGNVAADDVKEFGARLFDALFRDQLRTLYDLLNATHSQAPALWLVTDDASVGQIPWELLYDRRCPDLLAMQTPIVRGLTIGAPTTSLPVDGVLRVLVATAFPVGLEPLQGETETQQLARALHDARGGVQITTLPHATVSALQNTLREAEQHGAPYHILHLLCHGSVDPVTGESFLLLENAQGEAEIVQPSMLATLLRDHGLQLVFLNACHSAVVPASNLAPGFAQALLGIGIPIVVGMQAPIAEVDALRFATELYAAIADGRSVDAALLDVRRVTHHRSVGGDVAPALPVCYTRTMPARLLGIAQPPHGSPRWRAIWQATVAALALIVGVIGGYLTLRDFFCAPPLRAGLPVALATVCNALTPEQPPVIVLPTAPSLQLLGDFKIAIAEFAIVDQMGRATAHNKGSEQATYLYQALVQDLENNTDVLSSLVIGAQVSPQQVGAIEGDNYQAQVDHAVRRARELGADLLIFGNMTILPDRTVADLYFYLAPTQLYAAEEMAGDYRLLDRIEVSGSILDNAVTNSELRGHLLGYTQALAASVFGIGYFNRQQYNEASRWLEIAREELTKGGGRQQLAVIELFLGSTAAQLGDLPLAHSYYNAAIDHVPDLARAFLGRGQVRFLREYIAGGCTKDRINVSEIERAQADYQEALSLRAGDLAAIPTKVNLYQGIAYLCLALAQAGQNYWDQSQRHLERVVTEFETSGDSRLQYLAGQAYARIGVLHLALAQRNQPEGAFDGAHLQAAAQSFTQAVSLSRIAAELAFSHLYLAMISALQEQCSSAQEHLAKADQFYAAQSARDNTSLGFLRFTEEFNRLRAQFVSGAIKVRCPTVDVIGEG
jgi:tetratricopeptide (TPR) repeat protein